MRCLQKNIQENELNGQLEGKAETPDAVGNGERGNSGQLPKKTEEG